MAELITEDSGSGVDASTLLAILKGSEVGAGTDAFIGLLIKSIGDSGAGADTSSLLAEIISGDVASGLVFPYTFPFAFYTGSREDSSLLASLVGAEAGSGVDALLELLATLSSEGDSGVGVDTIKALLAILMSGDIASGVDALVNLLAALTDTDTGEGVDSVLNLDTLRLLHLAVITCQYRKLRAITTA